MLLITLRFHFSNTHFFRLPTKTVVSVSIALLKPDVRTAVRQLLTGRCQCTKGEDDDKRTAAGGGGRSRRDAFDATQSSWWSVRSILFRSSRRSSEFGPDKNDSTTSPEEPHPTVANNVATFRTPTTAFLASSSSTNQHSTATIDGSDLWPDQELSSHGNAPTISRGDDGGDDVDVEESGGDKLPKMEEDDDDNDATGAAPADVVVVVMGTTTDTATAVPPILQGPP
jgi:hypothetical protein